MKKVYAFTLAEVLITLGIIGIVAAMTLPALVQKQNEKEYVAKFEKFISVLSQAINMYKARTECVLPITECLTLTEDDPSSFDEIAKYMKVLDTATRSNLKSKEWLPDHAYNYYGEQISGEYGGISKDVAETKAYLLNDGTTFAAAVTTGHIRITFDVNGKSRPNRVGRDIYFLSIGVTDTMLNSFNKEHMLTNSDIIFYPYVTAYNTFSGMCNGRKQVCDPLNLDPTKDNGASITTYVLLTKKIPPIYRGN